MIEEVEFKSNIVFLEDDRIFLRALEKEDIYNSNYLKWLNDMVVNQFNTHHRFPVLRNNLLNYIEEKNNSKSNLFLGVFEKSTSCHIGNIILQNINWIDRNAEIAFILGEKEYWGTGIMYNAGSLLLKHAFKALNLHRIYLGTSSSNLGMQRLALKLGFSLEGRRIDGIYNNGEYHDILDYGLINNFE